MTDTVELTPRKAHHLHQKVEQIVLDNKKSCMDLAMILHETYISTIVVGDEVMYVYQSWGHDDWAQFVRTEMGIFKTTADMYRKVWRVFGIDLAGAYSQDELLPITKMKILASANLTRKNVRSWLKKANGMSCIELQREIFGHDRLHSVSFPVTSSEMDTINKRLDEYNELDSSLKRGEILTQAIDQWVSDQKKKFRLRKVG